MTDTKHWASTTSVSASMTGKEYDIAVEETTKTTCSNYGEKDMQYSRRSKIKMEDASIESTYHYADGIAYVNTPSIAQACDAMKPAEFIQLSGCEWNDEDINPSQKVLNEGDSWKWNTEQDDVSVMTVKETAMLRLDVLLSVLGIDESHILVEKYESKSEYIFDKELNPLSMSIKIQCEFEAFGQMYVAALELQDEYEVKSKSAVDELPAKDQYTETADLLYYQMFLSAYSQTVQLRDHTFKSTEAFSLTFTAQENYQLTVDSTITQDVTVEDVQLKAEKQATATIRYNNREGSSTSKQIYSVKNGYATDVLDGEVIDKSDWINPMSFYQIGVLTTWGVHNIAEDDVKVLSFTDNGNGQYVCKFELSADWRNKLMEVTLARFLGSEDAKQAIKDVKNKDFKEVSGSLTFDVETGAVMSYSLSVQASSTLFKGTVDQVHGYIQYYFHIYASPNLAQDNTATA